MPQREFWTNRHPTGMNWSYSIDPSQPDRPAIVMVNVVDQAHGSMDSGDCLVRPNVVHEAMADLLVASWEAYLFGEIGDVRQTIRTRAAYWLSESSSRPLWGEVRRR